MIEIIKNPQTSPILKAINCPGNPPMKCMNDACLSAGWVCRLYKGEKTEYWK